MDNRKITPEHLQSLIADAEYQRFGTTLTVCVLHLKSGFDVVGKSACIDKANFSEELGREYAYEDAFEQLWELEGYAMRQRLFEAANGRS